VGCKWDIATGKRQCESSYANGLTLLVKRLLTFPYADLRLENQEQK
jgi:hypothetical protein